MKNPVRVWPEAFFSPVAELQKDIDQLFGAYLQPQMWKTSPATERYTASVDVEETDNHFLFSFDLPGFKKEDIKIELQNNQLSVSGVRKISKKGKEEIYREFSKQFTLPTTVDSNQVEANYQDGVLTLAIAKAETAKPKTIKIGDSRSGIFSKLLNHSKEQKHTAQEETSEKVAS